MADLLAIGGLVASLPRSDRIAIRREESMERRSSRLTCPECRGPFRGRVQAKETSSSIAVASGIRIRRLQWRIDHRGYRETMLV